MRIDTSVIEIVWSCNYKDYVVTDTHAHTQTDYYNPPPTRSG